MRNELIILSSVLILSVFTIGVAWSLIGLFSD